FFQIYGSMIVLGAAGDVKPGQPAEKRPDSRELPFVKEALAAIEKGGYPEALARIGALLGQYAGPIPLDRLTLTDEIIRSDKVLSKISMDEGRRLRSEAGVMVLMEPERTLKAIPALLSRKEDRERVLQFLDECRSIEGITREQRDMLDRITSLLTEKKPGAGTGNSSNKKAKKK
ncbi:MAG: poly(3-hydroxybutyrate) depolymerase, partial [Syntrophaceae bacterium]